jgi:hypothetical protein
MYGATGTQEMLPAATLPLALEAKVIWCYLFRRVVVQEVFANDIDLTI